MIIRIKTYYLALMALWAVLASLSGYMAINSVDSVLKWEWALATGLLVVSFALTLGSALNARDEKIRIKW